MKMEILRKDFLSPPAAPGTIFSAVSASSDQADLEPRDLHPDATLLPPPPVGHPIVPQHRWRPTAECTTRQNRVDAVHTLAARDVPFHAWLRYIDVTAVTSFSPLIHFHAWTMQATGLICTMQHDASAPCGLDSDQEGSRSLTVQILICSRCKCHTFIRPLPNRFFYVSFMHHHLIHQQHRETLDDMTDAVTLRPYKLFLIIMHNCPGYHLQPIPFQKAGLLWSNAFHPRSNLGHLQRCLRLSQRTLVPEESDASSPQE
jgi:hypothetical protein